MADESLGAVAPEVTTPVAAPEATPAPDAPADQAQADPPEGESPAKPPEKTYTETEHRKAIQERLGKEQRRLEKLARAEAERDLYKQQLESLQRPQAPANQPSGEPQPKDYQDWESFNKAQVRYQVDLELGRVRQETQAEQQRREAHERAQTVQQKLASAKAKYEDFDEVALADNVPISQAMAAFIADSERGGDVAYHLGSHLDEADRIARLTPIQQVRELAKLESTLAAPPAPTRTPAPIVPNGTKTTVERDPSTMSDKEFNDWRRRQIAQRR